jgi:DNA uptake protein ComE-like DNA-binding protein
VLGLRKNITQGSFWFAITTLSILGIVRCHSQAQRQQTLRELNAPVCSPISPKGYLFYSGNTKFQRRWKSKYGAIETHRSQKYTKYPKPLTNKMAFALLMELRKSQEGKKNLQILEPQLKKMLAQKNPFPSNININMIDSAQLDQLPGIGSTIAKRILRFREKMGGFCSPHQMTEIPKIDTTLIEFMMPHIVIDKSQLIMLNKKVDYKQLYKHPYIGPNKAKILGPFLIQHPKLTHYEWEEMKGITADEKAKIAPYLFFIDETK